MDFLAGNLPRDLSPPPAESALTSVRQTTQAKSNERFLQEPTLGFLETHQHHFRASLVSRIFVLPLARLHLNSIGDIGQFIHIQVCDLSSNFIESFESLLINCRQLIKLDLHCNRINQLPEEKHWQEMIHLKLLYLHDNLLSSYDDIKSLSQTPAIEVLTLYDTPLSLKKNYRHHVVNSIWSLKALDSHILADDEIIEKTSFPEPYSAFSLPFKLNLYVATDKNSTIRAECRLIAQLLAQINTIQAHYCPVLILQKNFRMWLVQAQLREYYILTKTPMPKFLRPKSVISPWSISSAKYSSRPKQPRTSAATEDLIRSNKSPDSIQDRRQITVHIDKLVNAHVEPGRLPPCIDPNSITATRPARQIANKTVTSKHSDDTATILRGQKSQLTIYEPLEEWNDEIRTAKQYVQNLKDESHLQQRKRAAEARENNSSHRQATRTHTLDDRLLRTLHGSMAFGCLVAIDKAYADRTKIEQRKRLTNEVGQIRQEQSFFNAQLQHINDERLVSIHRTKDQDRMKQTYHRRRFENAQSELHDTVQDQRRLLLEQQKRRRAQIAFSHGFNAQHISISNALQRHESGIRAQRKAHYVRDSVIRQKQNTEEQARLIEKYLTQRQHVRRALSNIERKQLDVQAMRDASERLLKAQQRVAHIRARDSNIRQFSIMKMVSNDEQIRQQTQSLSESMLERESLFDTIADQMANAQRIIPL